MKKPLFLVLFLLLCGIVISGCGRATETPPLPTANVPPSPTAAVNATPSAPAPTVQVGPATPTVASTKPAAPETATGQAPTVIPPTATQQAVASPTARPGTPLPAAALVNGQPVPLADYETQVALAEAFFKKQETPGQTAAEKDAALRQVRRQVLDWMIDQLLIEQTAVRMGIRVSDAQVEAELAKARGNNQAQFDRWLKDNGLTAETFKAKLQSELQGAALRDAVTAYIPSKMEQVHLRHILVGSEDEARQILKQIKKSDDFVRLAKQYSTDMGTRETGGDLGFYPRGILSPEIDKVAFNVVVGQISDVIHTSFGYHIIQVIERDMAKEVSPEMMIALRQDAFMRWLEAERAKAKIEYLRE